MNFQFTQVQAPIRVMVVNPLKPGSQLLITKIMSGVVFGFNQFIDLKLLVYLNEMRAANGYVQELKSCAFPCYNSISASSDLPNIKDADVFCFMTYFPNPNKFDFEDAESDAQFDSLYLLLKIATSLGKPLTILEQGSGDKNKEKGLTPILVGDGLLVIDIMKSFSQNIPVDTFFAATPLRSISKTVLSDYLKVRCDVINDVFVWAVNDQDFHVEIKRPYLIYDKVTEESNWDAVGKEVIETLNLDHTSFNASFMKREFIEKVANTSKDNPYGSIFRAAEMSKTLRLIWQSRCSEGGDTMRTSLSVISDGSLGTIKGLPYTLPLIITPESWSVNPCFEELSHLRGEIKRMNLIAKEHHRDFLRYCKKFMEENIVKHAFIPTSPDSESDSSYSFMIGPSTRTSKV